MKRRLFNLAAGAVAALSVTIALLWVRSYDIADTITYSKSGAWIGVTSRRASAMVAYKRYHQSNTPHAGFEYRPLSRPSPSSNATFLGFRYWSDSGAQITHWELAVPFWFIALWLLAFPSIWLLAYLFRTRRTRRLRAGLCARCGYDLRATPGRCPECGTQAKPQRAEGAAA